MQTFQHIHRRFPTVWIDNCRLAFQTTFMRSSTGQIRLSHCMWRFPFNVRRHCRHHWMFSDMNEKRHVGQHLLLTKLDFFGFDSERSLRNESCVCGCATQQWESRLLRTLIEAACAEMRKRWAAGSCMQQDDRHDGLFVVTQNASKFTLQAIADVMIVPQQPDRTQKWKMISIHADDEDFLLLAISKKQKHEQCGRKAVQSGKRNVNTISGERITWMDKLKLSVALHGWNQQLHFEKQSCKKSEMMKPHIGVSVWTFFMPGSKLRISNWRFNLNFWLWNSI